MNCKQVQELLPLYSGGELEERRERRIMAHVQTCAECSREANEYRESRELLQEFTAPAVSEAVYAGIRRRVFDEIKSESAAASLPQFVTEFFRPRLTWAIASALLIAVSLFAIYLIANQRSDNSILTDRGPTTVRPDVNQQPEAGPHWRQDAALPSSTNETGKKPKLAGVRQFQREKLRPVIADRGTSSVVVKTSDVPPTNNLSGPTLLTTAGSDASEKTLRVEIQTKDPNIRIIWFSKQETKPAVPNSKGI